jgi:hypothetical protein
MRKYLLLATFVSFSCAICFAMPNGNGKVRHAAPLNANSQQNTSKGMNKQINNNNNGVNSGNVNTKPRNTNMERQKRGGAYVPVR